MDAEITLEIEFTAGVWTDVSEYLRRGNTRRGKQRAIEKPQPGRMTVTLANTGREFDPEYSGNLSPGNMLPDKGIRLSVTYAAVNYPQFTGQIDRITQRYIGPNDAVAVLECSDGLADLASAEVKSPLEVFMHLPNTPRPHSWYRLGEAAGYIAFDRSGNAHHGSWVGGGTSVEGSNWLDPDKGVEFENGLGNYIVLPPGSFPDTLPWSFHFAFKMPAKPPAGQLAFILFDVYYPNGFSIWVDDQGRLNFRFMENGAITSYARTVDGTDWASDQWYLLHVRMRAGMAIDVRNFNAGLSQINAASVIGSGGLPLPYGYGVIGHTAYPYDLDELMTFEPAAGDATFDALGFAGQAWANDSISDRVNRLLDAAGWTAPRNIWDDADGFLNATALNTSVLSHIEAIAESSLARLWVMKDGTFMFLGRGSHILYPYTESQATFGPGVGEIGYVQMGDYSLDLDTLENVGYRRNTGPYADLDMVIAGADWESVDKYRLRVGPVIESQFLTTDKEYGLVMNRIAHHKDPKSHVEAIRVLPQKQPALAWPAVLGLELADRVTFKRHPQGVGTAIATEVIVEGISNEFSPAKWETTLYIDATDALKFFRFGEVAFGSPDWRFST